MHNVHGHLIALLHKAAQHFFPIYRRVCQILPFFAGIGLRRSSCPSYEYIFNQIRQIRQHIR